MITRQPTGHSLSLGATATFTVSTTGTSPLSYQWRFNGVDLAGATNSRLVVTNVQLTAAGEYTVVVTNLDGTVTSQPAILDVDPTFTKIITDPIVTDTGYVLHGQAWADYDGDGDQDVLLVTDRSSNYHPLYRNNGDGTFTRVLEPSLQTIPNYELFCSWGDYDNDGRLDLFVADWGAFWLWGQPNSKNLLFHNSGDGSFTRITDGPIVQEGGITGYGAWGDYDRDGDVDMMVVNGGGAETRATNWFYQNQGDGSFLKLSNGLINPLIRESDYHYVPVWVDVDDDGWQDLFVAIWPGPGANHLYRNMGGGGFVKATQDPIVSDINYWGAPAWADYDNDGDLDMFITTGGRFFPSGTGPVALYRNDGTGHFAKMTTNDVGQLVSERVNTYACAWGDYDNDGWIDLYVPNGWKDGGTRPDLFYRNNGDGTFAKVTTGSPATEKGAGIGANWVDINNDGFLDLFTTKRPAPDNSLNRLYWNNGNSNTWLGVKCEGTVSPRWGTGAKVRVRATIRGTPMWQLRLIDAGGYSWGGQSFVAHFGLGDATVVDTLRIEWTSGIIQELKNVPVNRYLTVTEPPKLQMPQLGHLQVQCWRGQVVRIEQSNDLVTWTPLTSVTNLNSTGGVQWTDADAPGSSARFYRALSR